MIDSKAQNFAFHVGRSVGRYKLESLLGRGAMAEVYKSTHPDLGRDIAVKILHPFHTQVPGFIGRFRLEAQAAASLHHPNIVQVYDFAVTDDGLYYMVMQYINGLSLEEYLTLEKAPLSLAKSFWFFRQIANALQFAHQRGTIHRDVKPANIMLDTRENAYLSDFGLAKIVGVDRQTLSGMSPGTPSYMAPEHISGKTVTAAVDIYAMGVILYRMLTNRLPYEGDNLMTIITRTLTESPVPPSAYNPDIPPAVEEIVLKAMSDNPNERFEDAATMSRALADAMVDVGEIVPEEGTVTPVGVVPLPGLQLDNYKIKREFIRDNVGINRRYYQRYLAHNVALDSLAVLTVLNTPADEGSNFINRFLRRMDTVTLLDHPGLAAITRVDKTPDNQPYVAYEYIPGQSMEDRLAESFDEDKRLSTIESLQLVREIAEALKVAHDTDILHNDLRPENIVIREDGTPVLVGLEIPIAPDANARNDGARVLDYASPEQLEGQPISAPSNIFTLGVMLYELLSGHRPILNWDSLDENNLPREVSLVSAKTGLTTETYSLVDDCLQRQINERPEHLDVFLQRIDQAIAAESALLKKTEVSLGKRRRVYTAVSITALVFLMLGLIFLRGQADPLEEPATETVPSGAIIDIPTTAASPSSPTRVIPSSTPGGEPTISFSGLGLHPTATLPISTPNETPTTSMTGTPTETPSITPTPACIKPDDWVSYIVQEGDALFTIALQVGSRVEKIKEANCLNSNILSINQELWLPFLPPTATPTPTITPSPTSTPRRNPVPTRTPPPIPDTPTAPPPSFNNG